MDLVDKDLGLRVPNLRFGCLLVTKLLLIVGLIPICNVISGEWLSCFPERL